MVDELSIYTKTVEAVFEKAFETLKLKQAAKNCQARQTNLAVRRTDCKKAYILNSYS